MRRCHATAGLALCALLALPLLAADEGPALPPGLSGAPETIETGPSLPPGLGGARKKEEDGPALPPGLGAPPPAAEPPETWDHYFRRPFDLTGFWDARIGSRVQHDPRQKQLSVAETRIQLQADRQFDRISFRLTGDLLFDPVQDHYPADLERGWGWLDLREAYAAFTPVDFMDVKAGRQILTWGTGDMMFINDLFPKDWNSFLLGRDVEYLKAPSDAVKASFFSDIAHLDVVYTPAFDADRYVDGRRVTYWSNAGPGLTGADVDAEARQHWFRNDEAALRLYRNVGGLELAAYAYRGYWKSPAGMNPANGRAVFPRLNVYGASARGNVLRGIGNAEFGWYDSRRDEGGRDPLVRNGELRGLLGYEQEVARDFTASAQWYLEFMLKHADYKRALPPGAKETDQQRHVLTLRLTKLLMSQNLRLSLFTFYSPTDNDAYLRPNVRYKLDDHWSVEAGGNLFVGDRPHTFFGQFAPNSNVYVAAKYGF